MKTNEIASLPDYQDEFGNGFDQSFGWFFSNWGPSFNRDGTAGWGAQAAIDDNGTLGVRIVNANMQAEFVPISLMRDSTKGVWVNGLSEQADIIIIGQEYVIDGVAVAPTFQEDQQ